jgi:RNA polymerase sigma-70 factor (ECF subfamily)
MQDDRLRLIFTCCHPALSTQAQMALTLRLLGGLSTKQVASSFLVAEPAQPNQVCAQRRSGWPGSWPRLCPTSRRWPAYWRCCS